MYGRSSTLKPPVNSLQQLWRYFTHDRLMDFLSSEELFFAHLSKFPDGLEGSLTERTRERLFQWSLGRYRGDAAAARGEVEQYESHHDAFYANCWHMNDAESYLMWKVYGNQGFAIQTTFERVQIAFDRFAGEINGGVVEYIDFERDGMPIGNVFTAISKKDLPYRDEREFRLYFWRPGLANQQIQVGSEGLGVRVDLKKLIQKIVVGPGVKNVPSKLSDLLERKNIACVLATSVIKERLHG
jgi:hypothetical protein